MGFDSGAGSLAASGGSTSDIQFHWNKNDFSNFTQTNDYSYNASTSSWTTTTNVTVYDNGALIYGTEPPWGIYFIAGARSFTFLEPASERSGRGPPRRRGAA